MKSRISPVWWPAIGLSAPVLFPLLLEKNHRFTKSKEEAERVNARRIAQADPVAMVPLDYFELTPLVEQKAEEGFLAAPGVSYLIKTNLGSMLFDLGFGEDDPALLHNLRKVGYSAENLQCFIISHLHPDHMGGLKAMRDNRIEIPAELGGMSGLPCYLPEQAEVNGGRVEVVKVPRSLAAGMCSTGPLARAMFFMGWTEEQAIVGHLKDKGLVILTGCGHPTIEVIVQMVRRISKEPVYAIGGGLHFPLTDSAYRRLGVKMQMIFATGKPPWQKITDEDLSRTINFLNEVAPRHVLLSAHDTCDYSIDRLQRELKATTSVLRVGETYTL